MQTGSVGRSSSLPVARPTASAPALETGVIHDCFQAVGSPDFMTRAVEGLKSLCQSGDLAVSRQGHVALAAVLAAGAGPLAQALCQTAFTVLKENDSLSPAAFGRLLAEPLQRKAQNPVMFALTRAIMPHYGMAPGTQEVVDDLALFMSPIHEGADNNGDGQRIACLKSRLDRLGRLEDDHSYAGYLHDAARNGVGGPQVGEVGGRTVVAGVMVRRRK